MNKYPWYEEVIESDHLTQGDILFGCNIPSPDENLYKAILRTDNDLKPNVNIQIIDAIILSQACDIENDKIDTLVLCPVWSLSILMGSNQYYKSKDARESLRQGKEPAYHLLNEYISENKNFAFSVVDFHRIYSLPKSYLTQVAKNEKIRIRLQPPYREHLSQAFARYFMRVGLPIDIEKSQIRDFVLSI